MTELAQPYYVERDGLRGVVMPMPDGRFNWMARVTVTKTATCDTFAEARAQLTVELTFLSMMGDVVSAVDGAPTPQVAAVVPIRPVPDDDDAA